MGPQPVRRTRHGLPVVKLGLIARCEIARGIAIQSKNFYDHMPVERVLLVRHPKPDTVEEPDWYDNRTEVRLDTKTYQLDEVTVRRWLEGLDVVFTVEAPNDWRIPGWCREAGVKLIVQGNPEFVRHGLKGFEHLEHPDAWWWPSDWRRSKLPTGPYMPVPMPDIIRPFPRTERHPRILHVIGKRAWADRNGSDVFCNSLRYLRARCEITICALDGATPTILPNPRIKVTRVLNTVEDRWSMYEDHDLLVIPRRYGGLCLPALEAAAMGLHVMMPRTEPNEQFADTLVDIRRGRKIELACGIVETAEVNPRDLALAMEDWVNNGQPRRIRPVPRWSHWGDTYLGEMEALCRSK